MDRIYSLAKELNESMDFKIKRKKSLTQTSFPTKLQIY